MTFKRKTFYVSAIRSSRSFIKISIENLFTNMDLHTCNTENNVKCSYFELKTVIKYLKILQC